MLDVTYHPLRLGRRTVCGIISAKVRVKQEGKETSQGNCGDRLQGPCKAAILYAQKTEDLKTMGRGAVGFVGFWSQSCQVYF